MATRYRGARGGQRGRRGWNNSTSSSALSSERINSFEATDEMNVGLAERFRHNRPSTLATSNQPSSSLLLPFSSRLSTYDRRVQTIDATAEWLSKPEVPTYQELKCVEQIDPNSNEQLALDEADVNLINEPWPSASRFLEVHYKLLREDAVGPLRSAVAFIQQNPDARESDNSRVGIYDDANISGITFSNRGLGFRISFSLRRVGKQIRWSQSKRLVPGSIVALMPADDLQSPCLIATIAARPLVGLEKAVPEVDVFFSTPEDIAIDCRQQWIMVESREGYFEAHRHTLLALQKMATESFPFSDHLVNLKRDVEPPTYLQNIPPLGQSNLPAILDESQRDAMHRILTKSLALVQGPPGCGKTFVSTQAINEMLKNRSDKDPPIIIASHTNHAVDQILRYISAGRPDCFVRLGSRSSDPDIRLCTLYERKKLLQCPRSPTESRGRKTIRNLIEEMKALLEPFRQGSPGISLDLLQKLEVLTPDQCKSIENDVNAWCYSGSISQQEGQNVLRNWVGSEPRSPKGKEPFALFPEFEEVDMDIEELDENEAENPRGISDEEEIDMLVGEFFALGDKVIGASRLSNWRDNAADIMRGSPDLGSVRPELRGIIFDFLVCRAKEEVNIKFRKLASQYFKAVEERQRGRREQDAFLINQFSIVGLTTTGISKYRSLIAAVRPLVVLVEEAGEILEAPIIATCLDSVEHLILIGDHKQLQPQCNLQALRDFPYHLNISLFERLIHNGVEFSCLRQQRRMLPGIRRLLCPIYGDLIEDHPSVKDRTNRPMIPGMGNRPVWFFHHQHEESRDDQSSSYNASEAIMIVEFIRYLLYNEVSVCEITVLTFYNGQKRQIKALLRTLGDSATNLKVVTVDSYQGEENGIIILSLVRSNRKGNIGFLKVPNRVCVALSRARKALYIFGDGELLCGESKVWSDIIKTFYGHEGQRRRIGFTIPLQCEKHQRKTWIANLNDWENNAGGCDVACGEPMDCGHICELLCHPNEYHDCQQPCGRTLRCSHRCQVQCADPCRCLDCEKQIISLPRRHQNPPTLVSNGDDFPPINRNAYTWTQEARGITAWKEFSQYGVFAHDQYLDELSRENAAQGHREQFKTPNRTSSFSDPSPPNTPAKFRETVEEEEGGGGGGLKFKRYTKRVRDFTGNLGLEVNGNFTGKDEHDIPDLLDLSH